MGERRCVTIDVETGEWLPESSSIRGDEGVRIACSVLPGMPEELMKEFYRQVMENEIQSGYESVVVFSKTEVVSINNDLIPLAVWAIGPRQSGAQRVIDQARRLIEQQL